MAYQLRYCTKCLFPETKPDLFFDESGVCSACKAAELKFAKIDWKQREKDFRTIIDQFKLRDDQIGYDCLIPVSGGKDSTYQAYFIKEVYGMNPLCVCFETTRETELGRRNLSNISKMGIDVIHFHKNYPAYRSMVIEGFKRVGDEMWPNHSGIFTLPILVAIKFNIKLIIWGENPQQEYGGPWESIENHTLTRKWLEEFGGLLGNRIQDMIGVDGLTVKELTPYFYPTEEELTRAGLVSIFLGHYFFWDARKHLEIIEKHDHACIDIRNHRITREEGLKLVKKFDGKYPKLAVKAFIEYSGLSKEEIDSVINSFTNPVLFKTKADGTFMRNKKGDLIRNFPIR